MGGAVSFVPDVCIRACDYLSRMFRNVMIGDDDDGDGGDDDDDDDDDDEDDAGEDGTARHHDA